MAAAFLALVVMLMFSALVVPAAGIAGNLRPDVSVEVTGLQSDSRATYSVLLRNDGDLPAENLQITASLPAGLTVEGTGAQEWTATLPDLGVGGERTVGFVAVIDSSVPDGAQMMLRVDVSYVDPSGSRSFRAFDTETLVVAPRYGALTPFALLGAVAGALVVGMAYAHRVRAETVRIDQLFLLHDSGMLIRHYTNGSGLQRDGDIMSGMLIILQEFVRDSFNDHRNHLEEVRFGDKRVLMARGDHSILAAVVTGKRLNGLPTRLERAVADFERNHSSSLEGWNGNLETLDGAEGVFDRVLVPKYGSAAAN